MTCASIDRRSGRTVALLLSCLACAVFLQWGISQGASMPVGWRIDPSTASRSELSMLPGVGPSLARAIILERTEHGPFRSVDDLARVKGIGPARLAALRPWLRVEAAP
jgi:competence ComEA-like helix-hairpin-helix protein